MKKLLFLLILLAGAVAAHAALRLPEIIGNNMVLQQQSAVMLWGWANPDTRITVSASWDDTLLQTRSDQTGLWRISLKTLNASYAPQWITISDGQERRTLDNILIGEVWFCSGQSNMAMTLNGYNNQPVEGANEDIVRAGRLTGVRMATVPRAKASTARDEVGGGWELCTTQTAPRFSAAALYFARLLNETLDVPVGIIHSSWGGTRVEGWLPNEIVAQYEDVNMADTTRADCKDSARPAVMYNAMVHPLHNYTIRGFLFYQGCANVGRHKTYAERLATMVSVWRERWALGEIPFYFVEIAPYEYKDNPSGALLRESQHRAAELIPNSGVVSTSDLVKPSEMHCIHPARKREVGERLAFMALNRTYGLSGICCDGPEFRDMELQQDGSALLSFDNADGGFSHFGRLEGFEAAGADRVFHPAEATLGASDRKIRVSLSGGKPVAAVRYCFHNWSPGTLWNNRGLPVVPFRTDDWE